METFTITGMSCAACQARVEKAVSALPGVTSCAVSLLTNSLRAEGTATAEDIIAAVEKAGYGAKKQNDEEIFSQQNGQALLDTGLPAFKKRLAVSSVFLLVLLYFTMGHHLLALPLPPFLAGNHALLALIQLLLSATVMLINRRFFSDGFRALFKRSPNMDTLVALGSSVSFGWSVFVFLKIAGIVSGGSDLETLYRNDLYFESAAMIPTLITVGKLLAALAKGKTTNALKSLIKLKPKQARLIEKDEEILTEVEKVKPGDIFALRPGDSIPVDGVVTEGISAVDESALTGESVPVDKAAGDTVCAGTINRSGYLCCQATHVGANTSLSRIIRMVSDAAATKAPIARIADKASAVFVPAVILLSLLVCFGWLLSGADTGFALARGICVLVISCPCALGLATPVAIMVGNGLGAKNGILIKTGEALETIGKIRTVVLDKTGTVTEGRPVVTDIIPAADTTEEALFRIALSLESKSEHPLAQAIVRQGENLSVASLEVTGFKALSGSGIEATADGKLLLGGNRRFMESRGCIDEDLFALGETLAEVGKTPLYFACDQTVLGLIAVADVIKESSPDAIRHLKNLGLRVILLTGDNEKTAAFIGEKADVDEVIANVLPDQKAQVVASLQADGKVAMVGDGINDAPALTGADVGIAIGAGTDVAIDSASIVLMNSDLKDVAACVRLGRGTLFNIYENLFWAFFYNILCIPLAAGLFGLRMNPMYAAAAMSLSSVTVCLNALRLNLLKLHDTRHDRPRRLSQKSLKPKTEKTVVFLVEGMMCPHCEKAVKDALEALSFVESAVPDHQSGTVTVTLRRAPDIAAAKAAIEEKGYHFGGTSQTP